MKAVVLKKFRDRFEEAEFEACFDHWDKVLGEAEESDCLFQQIYSLIPTGKKIAKSKAQLLDMLHEKVDIECMCPDEDPRTPYIRNECSTISMFCDIDIELYHDELNYGEHNDPDHTWEREDNGRFYKHISCYRVCVPIAQL